MSSTNSPLTTPPISVPSPSPVTKASPDIRENIHQKIAGRSRFYNHVGYCPAEDAPGMVHPQQTALIFPFSCH
jgi:hypothetical protein